MMLSWNKALFRKSLYFKKMIYIDRIPEKFKGTVMQIEKALINGRLRVWTASKKFDIPTV